MKDSVSFAFAGIEVARRMREALATRKLLEGFLDSYSSTYDRAGLRSSPLRYRELLTTINREVWLALAARVDALLPARIPAGGKTTPGGSHAEAASAFRGALLDEIGKFLHWMPSDRGEFEHDLTLYAQIASRTQASGTRGTAEGAFVDRCALLLDPSMLEHAAAAAARFLAQLEQLAEVTLADVVGVGPAKPSVVTIVERRTEREAKKAKKNRGATKTKRTKKAKKKPRKTKKPGKPKK